jgi:UDP:flavonoid glycosyltransferase YjiC (YdhE family)
MIMIDPDPHFAAGTSQPELRTMRVAYYISSHGYGHAARQQPIIQDLIQHGVQVYVGTAAPEKFFRHTAGYHHEYYDIGMLQADALSFDVERTLKWYADFLATSSDMIRREVDFIRDQGIQMVVGDMPPIAFEIAERAGIPSIAITHFTWDWVYDYYMPNFPQYSYLIGLIRAAYQKATLALQMQIPIPHEFDMFRVVEPIPLVHNPISRTRDEIRQEFGVPEGWRMALLTMGGHEWGNSDIRALKQLREWIFLVMPGAWDQVRDAPDRFRMVPNGYMDYHNLIAHADVVVGKAGGSTVAEVIGHQTPMLYTLPDNWRESGLLDRTLREYGAARRVNLQAFTAGEWVHELETFANQTHQWRPVVRNGAEIASIRIRMLLDHL